MEEEEILETETEIKEFDLLAELAKETEIKTPQSEEKKESPKKSFWESDDFEQDPEEKPIAKDLEEKKEEKTVAKKITEAARASSASAVVGGVNLLSRMIFTPIETYKFKKKLKKTFSADDLILIDKELAQNEKNEIKEKQKKLQDKAESFLQKFEKRVKEIEFSDAETDEFTKALKAYSDLTGKDLPPGFWLSLSIFGIIGKRAIDAAFD